MTIWANTVVCNEDRFLWYAVTSVVDYVDRVLIWDTGSRDNTVEVIQELQKKYNTKIDFQEVGAVDPKRFTQIRQQMLDQTAADWLILVDGDEIWWKSSIKTVTAEIKKNGQNMETIVTPYVNVIGDIYHFQDETAGRYSIDERKGFLTIRAINRHIPGIHYAEAYGYEGLYDKANCLVQNRSISKRKYIEAPFMHLTHLKRSSDPKSDRQVMQRSKKYKFELGHSFGVNYKYPEVFYMEKPSIVADVWISMSKIYLLRAFIETILKNIKRRLFK